MTLLEVCACLGPVRHLYGEMSELATSSATGDTATSAAAERSFNCLRHIKTCLRSTMSEQRLNNLLILHTYEDLTDSLDVETVACDFLPLNDYHRGLSALTDSI